VPSGTFGKIASTVVAIVLIATVTWLKSHPSPTNTASGPAGTAQSGQHYDLGRDEQSGGHTLQRHVGRTDAELIERLQREPDISAASTYSDRAAAERTVAAALGQEHGRVESWLNRSDAHPNLALQYRAHDPIGRSIRRGERTSEPCYEAVVVLRWDGDRRFHVLTTYPEPSRAR
jgi:CDI toxin RNase A-like protein